MKNNRKGFTLAELLIVVAIIAVLVAIAIPVFSGSLNKAKQAADAANIRAGYAEVVADGLTKDPPTSVGETTIPATQTSGTMTIGGSSVSWETGKTTVAVDASGVITVK